MDPPRTPRLSLDLLRGFRAAARHLSFTRAAQELFVTQPAISREVRTLEEQLGTPLFRRINRTLQLTPAGTELYRVVDEALTRIDAAAQRVAGGSRALAVTLPVGLASMWLGPRLPRFARLRPAVHMRIVGSNDVLDLGREQIDVALRYVPHGTTPPSNDRLCDYETFPVCSPALARQQPIRTPADLAPHVLLDFETLRNGRPWFDWQPWFDAMNLRPIAAAGLLRFTHYDQVIHAACEGSGVAIGKRPHLATQLSDGTLVAPLGEAGVARRGAFYVIVADAAPRDVVEPFIAWLHAEAEDDARHAGTDGAGR